jgi:endonuclease G
MRGRKLIWRIAFLALLVTSLGGSVFATNGPSSPYTLCYGGFPLGSIDEVLSNEGYFVGYSDARKNPLWVCYRVFAVLNPVSHQRPSRFKGDTRTTAQVSHDDYTNSGYDRGHMAPNATINYCYGRDAQLETFYMSNVCPQAPTLNRGIWVKLEATVRDWANAFEEVWVFTGPIFDNEVDTIASGIEIPDAFYKIIIDEVNGSPRAIAFLIPQEVPPGMELNSYLTSVDTVEQMAGFDFLWNIADPIEEVIESQIPTELWTTSVPGPVPEPSPKEGGTPPPPPFGNVQITRVFYDGVVPRVESDEYVEITNLGQMAQDLLGWKLVDVSEGYPEFRFRRSYVLAPGATIRVYTNEIHPEWGGFSFGYGKAIWNNGDPDTAVLYDSHGQEVSRKSY